MIEKLIDIIVSRLKQLQDYVNKVEDFKRINDILRYKSNPQEQ